jgi:membrane protease YdiL (CAAX protease family)
VGLLPPTAILAVLWLLRALVAPSFTPRLLLFGVGAGVLAGFFEELGWSGFAYPRMRSRFGVLRGALLLGVLWGVWHLPVVDSLGAASPHGAWWPEFFATFVAVLVALRVLIAWVYEKTGSLLAAQLLHASSTACLVAFGPSVTAGQECLWYLCYAAVLWIVVAVVVVAEGSSLTGERALGHGRRDAIRVNVTAMP